MGVIPLALLYLVKSLCKVDFWAKTLFVVCSDQHIMHRKICGFIKSTSRPSFIANKHEHMDMWLWGFQAKACAFIVASCETSTTFNNVTLPNSKCTLSTFDNDEDLI
jgi:hypothetical protein